MQIIKEKYQAHTAISGPQQSQSMLPHLFNAKKEVDYNLYPFLTLQIQISALTMLVVTEKVDVHSLGWWPGLK